MVNDNSMQRVDRPSRPAAAGERTDNAGATELQAPGRSNPHLMHAFVMHELRSRVNIVINTSHLLQPYRNRLDTRGNRLLDAQQSSADMLLGLVEHLTQILSHGSDPFSCDLQPLSLAPWLSHWHAHAVSMPGFTPGDVPLQLHTPLAEVRVQVDPVRLGQCLVNLVSNARKYGHSDRGVSLSLVLAGDEAEIAVSDHGAGLTQEQQRRLFTPYERLGRGRGQPGQGLGLALTRMLIEAMGGRIQVTSARGQGSRFSLLLPRLLLA